MWVYLILVVLIGISWGIKSSRVQTSHYFPTEVGVVGGTGLLGGLGDSFAPSSSVTC
jgi:hypothetical protein